MIKQIWIAECDCCGKAVPAVEKIDYCNDLIYLPPDDWTYGHNHYVHMCPDCSKKLGRTEKFTR